jgi:hypothetical protein
MKQAFLLSLAILLFVSLIYAGTTGKIAGRVVDKSNGEALPFANIIIVGTTMGTVTDLNGDYFIINIPPGTYDVQARMMGYNYITVKNVKVEIDQTSTVNFDLPLEVIKMPETVVYGKKIIEPDVTYKKTEMSGEEIAKMAVSDPVEALLTNTSMVMDPSRREIHVRGGRGGEVLYLIDGMEVRDPLVGGNLAMRLDDTEINQMEMVLGGFNAEYGNAQSGIVNIVTREGSAKGHSVDLTYKSDRFLQSQTTDDWGRTLNSFNSDKASISSGGPEPFSKYVLPAVGLRVPWTITYYVSSSGDWTNTYTPFTDEGLNTFLTTYELWDKVRLRDRMRNVYTGNSKLACKFSATSKLSLGYRRSFERRYDYDHEFRYIPQNAYRRESDTYQIVADWNQTLSGNTFYTLSLSYFRTQYLLTPGGKMPDEINHYPNSSDDPLDVVIGYTGIDGVDEPFDDVFRYNGTYDGELFVDLNKNGFWDEGEPFTDQKQLNYHYDIGERFRDWNGDGEWTGTEPFSDWGRDGNPNIPDPDSTQGNGNYEFGEPFVDYNGNGVRDAVVGDQFYDYGYDQWSQYHKRYTNTLTIKGDITTQLTKVHMLKTGFEFKRYRMKQEEIQYPWYIDEARDPLPPGDWPLRGIFRDYFTRHPSYGAWYIQDKIETKGMILNLGLRLDFTYAGPETEEARKEEFSFMGTEISLSPRFGISFPITEFDKMYFSYGHFSQTPEYQYFYQDTTQFSSAIRLYGNPNLRSQSEVAYQLGVVHAFGNLMKIEIQGFYKDIRDLIDTEKRGYAPFEYQIWINRDYGSSRGVELSIDKRHSQFYSFSLAYTLMWAMGKSSSDRQGYDYDYQGIPLPLREYPLDWDQRHSLTSIVDLRSESGDYPVILGLSMPDKWGVNILTQFSTGTPYTPSEAEGGGVAVPNSKRKPYITTTNVKASKWFYIGPLRYEFLLEANNVFDRSNTLQVYSETGRADDSDKDDGIGNGTVFDKNPGNWGPRRQIYVGFGLGIDF